MPSLDTNALKNRAAGFMSGFSTGQRAVVVIAAAALIAGGVFFTQWASKPNMTPLFSNLEAKDASEITTKLQSQNVKYELADGGKTVMVPESQVHQLRLDLASQDLPTGGSQGYSLLDKQGVTTSEFRQNVDYKRALEGELSKTIGSINGVQAATVHLVMPKQDVFADDNRKPTASVLLQVAPNKSISSGQVQSVVNLVASSVEGLEPINVTVADDKGKMLAAPGQEGAAGSDDSQRQATTTLEGDLTKKIEQILTPLVGEGKYSVQARAELNFDKTNTTSEVWNPNNKQAAVGSQHTKTEAYKGNNPNATGVLGPEGVPLNESANGNAGDYTNSDVTTDYNNDRQVTQTQKAPGSVDRMSVAVLLDSSVPNIDAAKVQELVSNAVGLNNARGDTISVSSMPFEKASSEASAKELQEQQKAEKQAQMINLAKTAGTFLVILVVLILLFITTKRRNNQATAAPISIAELDAAMPALDITDVELDASPSLELDSPEAQERAKVDREITELIEKQPDEVASLLRGWLADRRH